MTEEKKYKTDFEAFEFFHKFNGPNAFIQWKGTDACMDIHCICGVHGHLDDFFIYNVKCRNCKRVYSVSSNIELLEIERVEGCEPKEFFDLETEE